MLPHNLTVAVPQWPDFHPPNIPQLCEDFGADTQRFQYWEQKEGVWYTGSKGTVPRDLRKLSREDLCYRSNGITRGIGMPGAQVKRLTPDERSPSETPYRAP